ncbi:hypothetical protein Btru_071699 [Bulinus truncatus]|nr:hypothetical protein Btru_071699 [Bulinus truncatus]
MEHKGRVHTNSENRPMYITLTLIFISEVNARDPVISLTDRTKFGYCKDGLLEGKDVIKISGVYNYAGPDDVWPDKLMTFFRQSENEPLQFLCSVRLNATQCRQNESFGCYCTSVNKTSTFLIVKPALVIHSITVILPSVRKQRNISANVVRIPRIYEEARVNFSTTGYSGLSLDTDCYVDLEVERLHRVTFCTDNLDNPKLALYVDDVQVSTYVAQCATADLHVTKKTHSVGLAFTDDCDRTERLDCHVNERDKVKLIFIIVFVSLFTFLTLIAGCMTMYHSYKRKVFCFASRYKFGEVFHIP